MNHYTLDNDFKTVSTCNYSTYSYFNAILLCNMLKKWPIHRCSRFDVVIAFNGYSKDYLFAITIIDKLSGLRRFTSNIDTYSKTLSVFYYIIDNIEKDNFNF